MNAPGDAYTIDDFIENLYSGEAVEFGRLKVTPVFARQGGALPFLDLEEALRQGLAEVSEVSEHGSVPDLRVINKAARDLLILDGEELVGAKQNRIVNTTIVVPAHSTVEIPVTCVEQGRWRYSAAGFSSSSNISYASLRARKHSSVSDSLRQRRGYTSDQLGVWGDIRAKMTRMSASSETTAMSDLYESSIDAQDGGRAVFEEQVTHRPGQVGYFAFVGGGFAGGDIFGAEELCRAKLAKFLRSHYLDALDGAIRFPPLSIEQVIGEVRGARAERFEAVGKGAEFRFEGAAVQGAWKAVDGLIPHLMVFPKLN